MSQVNELKPSGIKWIGEIPSNWECKKIKYLSSLKGRIGWQGLTSDEYKEVGPYLITGTDFENGTINWDSCVHITEERWAEAKDIRIKNGDLLITKDGTVGKVAIVTELDGKASLNSGVLLIKTYEGYSNEYLYWVLQSDVFWTWFNYTNAGNSTIIHLYQGVFAEFKYPMPHISEQLIIAKYLNEECAKIDSIISDLRTQVTKLESYRKSHITEVITKGLRCDVPTKDSGISWIGKIPQHWEVRRLKYIGTAKNGLTYSPDDVADDGIMVLRSSNVQNGKLSFEDNVYVNMKIKENLLLQEDDILICSRNGSRNLIGKCALIDKDTAGNTYGAFMCVFRSDYNKYIYYVLQSNIFDFYLATFLTSTVNQLTNANLYNIKIPITFDIEEQGEIVNYLDDKCKKIESIISEKKAAIEKMEKYKKSLIYEYVTGKKRLKRGDEDAN